MTTCLHFFFFHLNKTALVTLGLRGFTLGKMGKNSFSASSPPNSRIRRTFSGILHPYWNLWLSFLLYFGCASLENSSAAFCLERISAVCALFWVWGSDMATQTGTMVP